jgi:stage III sporulation protein AH
MNIKKNGAVISVIVLLLCVAVYLNWSYSRTAEDDAAVSGETIVDVNGDEIIAEPASDQTRFDDSQWVIELTEENGASAASAEQRLTAMSSYFDETRLDRETSRDGEITILKETLDEEETTQETRLAVEEQIASIAANSATESRIESLVMAKGFLECVAMISDSGVSVVVLPETEGLQASDVAKIKDIIISETGVTADLIRIIESR